MDGEVCRAERAPAAAAEGHHVGAAALPSGRLVPGAGGVACWLLLAAHLGVGLLCFGVLPFPLFSRRQTFLYVWKSVGIGGFGGSLDARLAPSGGSPSTGRCGGLSGPFLGGLRETWLGIGAPVLRLAWTAWGQPCGAFGRFRGCMSTPSRRRPVSHGCPLACAPRPWRWSGADLALRKTQATSPKASGGPGF